MTGGVAQFMRVMESIPTDAPIADRFHATLEASDVLLAAIEQLQQQHRADMVSREAERKAINARLGGKNDA